MPKVNLPPTRTSLLALRRQLAFELEGHDLLEQKRQILVFELASRVATWRQLRQQTDAALREAFLALREALVEAGSDAIDRASLGVPGDFEVRIGERRLGGLRVPQVLVRVPEAGAPFGPAGTSARADEVYRRFREILPRLGDLAELQTVLHRLTHELRKTQRRCNALARLFIPDHREAIGYIAATLEERERESLGILRMIRDRSRR